METATDTENALTNGETQARGAQASAGAALAEISVIIPVKNEAAGIGTLLGALINQSLRPSEIVITDGGSTDGTREAVREFARRSPVPVVLIEVEQAFPGRGRNLAIERARHEWIASIDGGNRPEPDWLAELVRAARANPEARIVYGKFRTVADSYFTECAAIAYLPPAEEFHRFIASSLIHRSAWRAAGGFREDLRSGEDLLFFDKLEEAGVVAARTERAVVHWSLQPNARGTLRRFALYSRHGMKAGLGRGWQLGVARFYLVLLVVLLAGAIFWWPLALLAPAALVARAERRIYRWAQSKTTGARLREMLNPKRVLYVVWINLLTDAATFLGVWQWLRRDYVGRGES